MDNNYPLTLLANTDELTMSSREIAELTGKRHDNVMRDIRNMLTATGAPLKIEVVEEINNLGMYVKRKYYLLNKTECLCLLAGYSAKLCAAIVDRWLELEAQQSVVNISQSLPLPEALRMVADLEEQKQQLSANDNSLEIYLR